MGNLKPTDKQIAANRRNATHSTGPTTPPGKVIAARNALKHGLLAQEIVIDAGEGAESRAEFEAVLTDLQGHFDPQGPLEEMLVEKIAVAYWRLRRAHRYEVGVIRSSLDDATGRYYAADKKSAAVGHPVFAPSSRAANRPDDEIDAEIRKIEEQRQAWQDDKKRFTAMRKAGKDLQEIYEWDANWEWLYEKVAESVGELPDESPAAVRQALNAADWTDDAIWQFHVDYCTEQAQQQQGRIEGLQQEKRKNELALQVRKKLGSIPAGHELDKLLKYEGAIERQFYKAIDQLERLQRLRAGEAVPAPVNVDVRVDTQGQE